MVAVAGASMDSPVHFDRESEDESAGSDSKDSKYSTTSTPEQTETEVEETEHLTEGELATLPDDLDGNNSDINGNYACRFCSKRFTLVSAPPPVCIPRTAQPVTAPITAPILAPDRHPA